MISVHCPRHGREVLLGHHQILGIDGRGQDMTVRWICWCGHHGTHRVHPAGQAA
ncbi:MAG TPA: hypothetical protein VF015_01830 [Acidimicrobiales bacterium]|jgi:hypothetical protein